LEPVAAAFCEKARKYDLVLVPGDGFGCPGHVRIAFCTSTDKVQRSLERFEKLIKEYK
jgi:aspartate aminotransferase